MSENASTQNDETAHSASLNSGRQPGLTGCPWHDVNEMLQAAGLRPTRQRMAFGWLLAALGAGFTTRFLATSCPSKTGLMSEPSIGGVCASGKPGMGGEHRVSIPPVYAVHSFGSSLAWSKHGPSMVRNRESWG